MNRLVRIDGELLDKLALFGELNDFARLVRIGINHVAVGNEQMAVWSLSHAEWTVQVNHIAVNNRAFPSLLGVMGLFLSGVVIVSRI